MKGLPDSAALTAGMKIGRSLKKSSKVKNSEVEIFTPEFKKLISDWFVNLEAQLKEKE